MAEENCREQAQALRGEELRIYQRTAHREYGVREHGEEENDAHHRHGTLAGGHVPAEGIGDPAKQRHEIPTFPVDLFREGIAGVRGASYGV